MRNVLIGFGIYVFRFINIFLKPLSLKKEATIISRQSDKPTLDIKLLNDCLNSCGIKTVVLTKTLKNSFVGIMTYGIHMFCQMYHIATSKVIIVDGYCLLISVLPKKGQKVIQMWHALGAIKKFGWQSIDKPEGHSKEISEMMNMHQNYDFVLAPSKITGEVFTKAFSVSEEKIIYYGLPRIDFIHNRNTEIIDQIEERYPQIKEKVNVLYVPTFRKTSRLCLEKLISEFDFENYNFIIKKHFLDKDDYSWTEQAGSIVDETYSSVEWLQVCEKVITDYSAMAFEAAISDKELYIYQPDIGEYEYNVGLNIKFNEEALNKYVCETESDLLEKLKLPYNKNDIISFRKKYIEVDLNNCTERLCDFVIKQLNE